MKTEHFYGSLTIRLNMVIILMIGFFSILQSGFSQESFQLPWERELPLKEAAKTVFLQALWIR
jgi:hypothetical protein